MRSGLRVVFTLCASIALGTMVFFIAIVAQEVFASLPLGTAGNVLANIFPPYYTLTTLLCIVATACSWPLTQNRHGWWVWSGRITLLLTSISMLVGWLVLLPVMNRLRLAIPTFSGPQTPKIVEFFMYHGISMGLNLLAVVFLAYGLAVFSGIRESR